jgi:predicted PurR-regulated permease PerM
MVGGRPEGRRVRDMRKMADVEAKQAEAAGAPHAAEHELEPGAIAYRRDRLLAALTLIAGASFALALPFALRAGAEFFLPVTAAIVIAIALVPLLEWLERRGLPSAVASLFCILLFLAVANVAVVAILVPMMEWVRLLPERIGRIQQTLAPLFEVYAAFEEFIDDVISEFARSPASAPQTVTVETPNSLLSIIATSAPYAAIQMLFAVLLIFFFLAGWTRMRKRTITSRGSFDGAMTTARVIQQVVDATSTYLGTITMVNIGLGLVVAFALYLIGMPTPLMWGGIVAVLNYIPYLGPLAATLLLILGGLMAFPDPWQAFLPALIYFSINLVEANVVTPTVVGRRLTINPMLILLALSFWAWVWGTTGALLAVPILIILRTVLEAAGKPDIAGFLFEEGTLIGAHHEEPAEPPAGGTG